MNAQPDVIIGLDVGTTAVKVAAFARTPANASSAPRCANIDSSDQNRVGKCRTRKTVLSGIEAALADKHLPAAAANHQSWLPEIFSALGTSVRNG